jgi:parallel beta-helix repeat protein
MNHIIRRWLPLVIAVFSTSAASSPQPFVHPGILQTLQDLEFMKQKVAAGEQPWKQAWENLLHQPYSSLDFRPQPVAQVIRGPYGRPTIGGAELSGSANAANSQALQWYITGDAAHAKKAIEILNAWSGVLWDFQDNDAKLLAGFTGGTFCNAAEIMRATRSGWERKDQEQFKRMLLTVYYPLIKDFMSTSNGNWDAGIMHAMLAIGIFCDDQAIFDRAVDHFLHGGGNGGITKYVYPSGQCQENTRDQNHSQLGLGYLALAARIAWNQGVDLYATADNRLALGFEFTARYMLGERVPVYGVVSATGRGRFSDIYEGIYQHYHYVKGLEMPYTKRATERTRASGTSWSALTMYRGPLPQLSPPSVGAPRPGKQAADAGALAEPTAPQPADAVAVAPGQSIQEALDARGHAGGGWVVLAKGLHTLPATLRIPSGITLAGQGRETILFLEPKLSLDRSSVAIVNAVDDLRNVTLRDFALEGAMASEPSRDPNEDRRQRSFSMAPVRAGIAFTAQHANQMRNIRFEHLTVRNFTHDGVAIRGAAQVVVAACHFNDSGSSVMPGIGLQHNLLITRATGVEVKDSRLDNSPWGSGLDLSHSRDAKISNNQAARNALDGIRVTESQDVRVRGNLTESNDHGGIVFDAMMDGNRGIDIRDNLSRNNGGYGIEVSHAVEGVVKGNTVLDNARPEKVRVVSSERIVWP